MSIQSNTDTLVGARLGSCALERVVGRGGMGAVYLARQEHPRRQVAVKVVRPRTDDDPAAWSVFLARFRAEADAAAALDHTNIVPVYEFGEVDGAAYLVMPYLADGSLDDLLTRSRAPLPLPLPYVVSCVSQIAAALDHAHARGIVHRDVKPSNVLLHTDGRLLLADFGIARALRPLHPDDALATLPDPAHAPPISPAVPAAHTVAGSLLGTPEYIAPEQIRGESVTPATDIYALGVLTYTLLAGHPPFYSEATGEILRQHLTEAPPPVRALRPDVPREMDAAIAWALTKRPQDRPASAGAFARALGGSSHTNTAPAHPLPGTPLSPPRVLSPLGATETLFTLPAGSPLANAPVWPERGGPGPAAGHDTPTLYDPVFSGPPVGRAPANPHVWPGPRQRPRRSFWGRLATGIAAAIAFLLVLGLLAHSAALGSHSQRNSAAIVRPSPTATATATPTPLPTATPVINWLTVSPASVSLGCDASTQTARVVLRNLGPQDVWFVASYSWLGGVSVDPLVGPLPSGNSTTITIKNTSSAIFGGGNQGAITFTPNNSAAGQPPTLTYTTQGC